MLGLDRRDLVSNSHSAIKFTGCPNLPHRVGVRIKWDDLNTCCPELFEKKQNQGKGHNPTQEHALGMQVHGPPHPWHIQSKVLRWTRLSLKKPLRATVKSVDTDRVGLMLSPCSCERNVMKNDRVKPRAVL